MGRTKVSSWIGGAFGIVQTRHVVERVFTQVLRKAGMGAGQQLGGTHVLADIDQAARRAALDRLAQVRSFFRPVKIKHSRLTFGFSYVSRIIVGAANS